MGLLGEDRTGEQFYSQYGSSSQRIHEAVHGAKLMFDSTSDGIGTMARGLENMEDTHITAARRLTASTTDTGSTGHGTHK